MPVNGVGLSDGFCRAVEQEYTTRRTYEVDIAAVDVVAPDVSSTVADTRFAIHITFLTSPLAKPLLQCLWDRICHRGDMD